MSPPSVTITQLEPVVFLRGQSATGDDARGRRRPVNLDAPPSQLRALLTLYLPKPSKIRSVSVTLTGTARTDWPEGIGPNRLELVEEVTIFKHVVSLFNAKHDQSLPERKRSNSVGPGIGLPDNIEWDGGAPSPSPRGQSTPRITPTGTSSSHTGPPVSSSSTGGGGGSNLARQIAGVAARAGTAIIPPTFRPDIGLARPKDSQQRNSRPPLHRAGSGPSSWSSSSPGRRVSPDSSPSQPSQSPSNSRSGFSSTSQNRAEDRSPTGMHDSATYARWNAYLNPDSQAEAPPVYEPRSAPLYGYQSWPSNPTLLSPPAQEVETRPGGSSFESSSTSSMDPASTPQADPSVSVAYPATAPSSPTTVRAGTATTRGRGILNHQQDGIARARDHSVRFDSPPAAGPSSSPAARDPSRSAPSSRRNSIEYSDKERSQSRGSKSGKAVADPGDAASKGKKSGLKGLIGGLRKEIGKEAEPKAEVEPGSPAPTTVAWAAAAASTGTGGSAATAAAADWKEFKKGTYTFPISIALPSNLPPTLHADFGFNQYSLKAVVNRAGALTPNLMTEREVKLIHAPDEDALDETESIVVERCWEDSLSYMVVLSGKSFPIGRPIPLWIKFVPQDKVRIHRIVATLEERTDYFAKGRRVARHEVPRKWTLLKIANDKQPEEPLLPIFSDSPSALEESPLAPLARAAAGNEADSEVLSCILDPNGPWELSSDLIVPEKTTTRINISTNHAKSSIAVHHLIRLTIRVSKAHGAEKGKPKQFDIIIEAPITLTSTHTAEEWTSLPNYWNLPEPGEREMARAAAAMAGSGSPPHESVDAGAGAGAGAGASASASASASVSASASASPLQISRRWLTLSSTDAAVASASASASVSASPPAYERNAGHGERTVALASAR